MGDPSVRHPCGLGDAFHPSPISSHSMDFLDSRLIASKTCDLHASALNDRKAVLTDAYPSRELFLSPIEAAPVLLYVQDQALLTPGWNKPPSRSARAEDA
jgi:hypothetical protein